jgi:hypothetical protein
MVVTFAPVKGASVLKGTMMLWVNLFLGTTWILG